MLTVYLLQLVPAALLGATLPVWSPAGADVLPGDGPTLARLGADTHAPQLAPLGGRGQTRASGGRRGATWSRRRPPRSGGHRRSAAARTSTRMRRPVFA